MIIKQCLQKKPDNRATIDEIIFSEDFQAKAKVNKITLPRHLNKQKLMQSLQVKRVLDADEHKLIMGLSERGFLPKEILNSPAMIQTSLEEANFSTLQKQKSNGTAGERGGISSRPESSQGLSPPNPKLFHQARSN